MSKYVPPHQRRQISDDAGAADSGSRESCSQRQGQSWNPNLDQDSRGLQGYTRRGAPKDMGIKSENTEGPGTTHNFRHWHDPGEVYTLFDIERHFYPEDGAGEGADRARTLHGSSKFPDGLAFVILFHRQNPQWNSDGIIFVKSHLSRLPEYHKAKAEVAARKVEEDHSTEGKKSEEEQQQNQTIPESPPEDALAQAGFEATSFTAAKVQPRRNSVIKLVDVPPVNYSPSDSTPIAVFEQTFKSRDNTNFIFTGWHSITDISLIAPRSNELVHMLEQKWSPGVELKRDMTAWARSLEYEWAVIKMSKIVGDGAPEPPKVQQAPKRSVNELLAELRMGSTGVGLDDRGSSGKENSTTKQRNEIVDEEDNRIDPNTRAVEQK